MDISIIIPAYNEADRISSVLDAIESVFDSDLQLQDMSYEVLVVADGCTDGTVEYVNQRSEKNSSINCISYSPNHGKGYAIKTGMLGASGEVRFFMDADGSTSLDALEPFVKLIKSGADVVIGSRRAEGAIITTEQSLFRKFVGTFCSISTQVILNIPFKDTQCGFKAFNVKAAEKIFTQIGTDGFAIDIEMLCLARKFGYNVKEVGVTWADDERSSVNAIKDGVDMFIKIFQFRSICDKQRENS